METNLLKRIFINRKTKVARVVYAKRFGEDIGEKTIIMGEYQIVKYSEREEELVGCWDIVKREIIIDRELIENKHK